jgi:hypothetical protein
MKTLLLLGCAFCLGACGSGGKGSDTYQASVPGNAGQTPQTPLDSVPPLNSQSPALNDQSPPLNSQSPSLVGNAPITCAQAYAALRGAGCDIGENEQSQCEAAVIPGAPCLNEIQALLRCYATSIVCDDSGHAVDNTVCSTEATAVDACESAHAQNIPPANPTGCSTAGGCNCTSDCESCLCLAEAAGSATSTCDVVCSLTN